VSLAAVVAFLSGLAAGIAVVSVLAVRAALKDLNNLS